MATAGWRTDRPLKELVFERHGSFNVFQLLRLLQWKQRQPAGQRLRFRADLSAAFPGREISRLEMRYSALARGDGQGAQQIEITTPNYCVASTLGPLPEPFTEWVRDQERARTHAMPDFFNIFNQRLNLLRFQLKARQTPGLNNARPEQTPHAYYLAALMGLGQPELAAQVPLPQRAWLGLAGLLSNCRKSASTVTHVLSLFLSVPVKLEQQVGAWQTIEADDRIALGRHNHRLGQQSLLGRRVWDQQARVRLIVAPLPYKRFCLLLPPNGASGATPYFDAFEALLRLLLDRLCDCEVQLQALSKTIPASTLTALPEPATGGYRGLRLGQTAWLKSKDRAPAPPARRATYLVRAFDQQERA